MKILDYILLERTLYIKKSKLKDDGDTYSVINTRYIVKKINELIKYYGIQKLQLKSITDETWIDGVEITVKCNKSTYLSFVNDLLEDLNGYISGVRI